MDKIYTVAIRQSIFNACGTNAIFSVADPDTAKFLSDKIGETEYIEMEKTQSMGVNDNRDGISLSQRKRLEKLILPSQIIGLRDIDFYLKIPNYSIAENMVFFKRYQDRHDRFVMRSELSLERIMAEQREVMRKAQEIAGVTKEREDKREETMDGLSRELKEGKQEEERIIEDELYY
ncbi:MAG: type IV secretion system DNA-binding domain-containing protein [Nitrospinae bacterium]|nr:type IV secretion system DNA-binding domain-containing protein [Nitrospinota bacterium]MBI3814324.1 type IV secretion system DNA-binding domain-containing protein [Nitrospinota bacterium]